MFHSGKWSVLKLMVHNTYDASHSQNNSSCAIALPLT